MKRRCETLEECEKENKEQAERQEYIRVQQLQYIQRMEDREKRTQAYNDLLRKTIVELLELVDCPECGIDKPGAYYGSQGEVIQCQWCDILANLK